MLESKPLAGRTAVVTGASRGIGAATARALAEAGATVVVAARSEREIEGLAAALRDAGHEALAVRCDVTAPEEILALRDRALEACGPVHVLVNNAGIADSAPLKSISLERWQRIFAVNVTGVFLCSQAFLPSMQEAGWGRIVNVASVAGKAGAAYITAYAASKHAVIGFTRALADEVALQGVTVNAVCPGYVDTEMTTESVARIAGKTGLSEEEAMEHILAMSPQHRLLEAEEIAFAVLELCHPRAKGINGQAIVVDGGRVQS
jgi:NAD(P)-dependent dehydrogenase (short-subunit alcohol dehydrogenase family)